MQNKIHTLSIMKKIFALCIVFSSLFFFYYMYSRENEIKFVKLEEKIRCSRLETLSNLIIKSNIPFKDLSLFSVMEKNSTTWILFITPGRDSPEEKKLFDLFCINPNVSNFYQYCQYRFLKDDLGWWGIVELKKGVKGDYYLMITNDLKIIKIKEAFLPEQIKYLKEIEK